MGIRVSHHRYLSMFLHEKNSKQNYELVIVRICQENDKILMRRCRYYMLQLGSDTDTTKNTTIKCYQIEFVK